MKTTINPKKEQKSKPVDLSKIPCLVCLDKKLVHINPKEVKCPSCFSVYTLELLLRGKG